MKVDRKLRTVTVRGPDGRTVTLDVPKEAQNFDRVKPGASFKIRYVESVALTLQKGGQPSAAKAQAVKLSPKGGTPGGVVVNTAQISATVEAIDYTNRSVAVKGPRGNVLAFKVSDDVPNLDQVNVGDLITMQYTEALAIEMLPQAAKTKDSGASNK
jgi:hypothetical protein